MHKMPWRFSSFLEPLNWPEATIYLNLIRKYARDEGRSSHLRLSGHGGCHLLVLKSLNDHFLINAKYI